MSKNIPEEYEHLGFLSRRLVYGLFDEARTALRANSKPEPKKKFLIFAQGRTGSTLLADTLNSHPQIFCDREILCNPRVSPLHFPENRARTSSVEVFGFRVKCYQLTKWQRMQEIRSFLESFQERGWKMIYLWRENVLEHAISNVFSNVTKKFHHRDDTSGRPKSIRVDPGEIQRLMRERLHFLAWEREALSGLPYLEINYDRDLLLDEAKEATFARVLAFLEVPPADLAIPYKKSVNKSLDQIIENYQDLVESLTGTDLEKYLASAHR